MRASGGVARWFFDSWIFHVNRLVFINVQIVHFLELSPSVRLQNIMLVFKLWIFNIFGFFKSIARHGPIILRRTFSVNVDNFERA